MFLRWLLFLLVAAGLSGGGASLALAGTGLGMPLAWAGATASTAAVAAGGAHMAEAGYKIGSAALAMAGLVRGGGREKVAEAALNPKIYTQLEKQLAEQGAGSIHKALRSAQKTLAQHEAKLPGLEYKSQVEGTIRNVQGQIRTIEQFIKDKGL